MNQLAIPLRANLWAGVLDRANFGLIKQTRATGGELSDLPKPSQFWLRIRLFNRMSFGLILVHHG